MKKISSLQLLNQPLIPDFSDPLALLVHCHERIERQLRALERAGELLREGAPETLPMAFVAIDQACAHFAGPGVKHTADEEVSLFPRLRECSQAMVREALAALDELEPQHRTAESLHAEFDAFIALLPRDGLAELSSLDRYEELTAQLTALYRPHIRLENELIFPAAAQALSPEAIALIGAEMRARRQRAG
ncbi:MAG TPA: hemerythrin domain-containing protein [Blastocatellia bacterium]|nr:hemerythrin domain-containing protein [Blastocatellia bacterium]